LNPEESREVVRFSRKDVLFGDHCTIKRFGTIQPTNILLSETGEGLKIGNHSNIGAYSYVGCSGYIEIGNNVMMGHHVNLLAENHNFDDVTKPMIEQGVTRKGIIIIDEISIGANECVTAGVRIGTGAVIAAGVVVTKDVPPFSISGGIPARTLRMRNAPAAHE
jgi:acetyltransferase-like isoleucine patch superfamily enzyme